MPADISFTVITAAEAPGSTSSMLIALEKTAGRLVPGGVVVILGCGTDSDRHSTNIPELYVTTAADRSAALAVARAFVGTRDMLDLKATGSVCVVKRQVRQRERRVCAVAVAVGPACLPEPAAGGHWALLDVCFGLAVNVCFPVILVDPPLHVSRVLWSTPTLYDW